MAEFTVIGSPGAMITHTFAAMTAGTLPDWAVGVRRIAALTGAGISTDSGIPDYRGPQGVWTRDPSGSAVFTLKDFLSDPATRQRLWRTYADHVAWSARPNRAHEALVTLERAGLAVRILTQNVDGLHQLAGSAPRKVLELHGSMRRTACRGCGRRVDTIEVLARVRAGEAEPCCTECGGILKPDVVMFGENLDGDVFGQAQQVAGVAQLMIAVGSTLQVVPAASLCRLTVERGGHLVVVNRDPTPYDWLASEVIREPIGAALPRIVALVAGTSTRQ